MLSITIPRTERVSYMNVTIITEHKGAILVMHL